MRQVFSDSVEVRVGRRLKKGVAGGRDCGADHARHHVRQVFSDSVEVRTSGVEGAEYKEIMQSAMRKVSDVGVE
eukprot:1162030-Pelagomonas_calceolata.AAC.5